MAAVFPENLVAEIRRPRIGRLDLVVAVACLGALAAVAIPRQLDVTAKARRTEVSALAESVRSAARLGHSLWQAGGAPDALDAERGRVNIVNGWPATADLPLLLEEAETLAFSYERGTWTHRDAGAHCGVRYAPPLKPGRLPDVEVDVGGC